MSERDESVDAKQTPAGAEAAPTPTPAPAAPAPVPVAAPRPPVASIDPVDVLRAKGKHVELAAFLAFLVPGLGHLYLGKRAKGAIAFVLVCGLYAAGVGLSRGEAVSLDKQNGHPYAFLAQVGCGGPTAAALLHTHKDEVRYALKLIPDPPDPPVRNVTAPEFIEQLPRQDEGLLYTMIAGLLNLLLIHDAFSGAPGVAAPREDEDDDDHEDEPAAEGAEAPRPPPEPTPAPTPGEVPNA